VWLPPGVALRTRLVPLAGVRHRPAAVLSAASQVRLAVDVTEDRRNSFPAPTSACSRRLAVADVTIHRA
jgi:hypothetical protein